MLTPDRYPLLRRLVDRAKPISRHYSFEVGARLAAGLTLGGAVAPMAVTDAPAAAVAARDTAAAGLAFGGGVAAVQVTDALLPAAA